MRSEDGTYALLLRVPADVGPNGRAELRVGALGTMTLRVGLYVYVGRAFGSGGLRARVRRHAGQGGAQHWHIDYLRPHARLEAVWYTHDPQSRECAWARILRKDPRSSVPMAGFGASDCDCSAHLVGYDRPPSFRWFEARTKSQLPDHGRIESIDGASLVE